MLCVKTAAIQRHQKVYTDVRHTVDISYIAHFVHITVSLSDEGTSMTFD